MLYRADGKIVIADQNQVIQDCQTAGRPESPGRYVGNGIADIMDIVML